MDIFIGIIKQRISVKFNFCLEMNFIWDVRQSWARWIMLEIIFSFNAGEFSASQEKSSVKKWVCIILNIRWRETRKSEIYSSITFLCTAEIPQENIGFIFEHYCYMIFSKLLHCQLKEKGEYFEKNLLSDDCSFPLFIFSADASSRWMWYKPFMAQHSETWS